MRLSYAIVFVSDMSRSVAFYRDVIGLPLRFESPHWTEFATEGAGRASRSPISTPSTGAWRS
jgi:catechol 2,3-dioxygenase-like lactoylglutathione lyase family enzyme